MPESVAPSASPAATTISSSAPGSSHRLAPSQATALAVCDIAIDLLQKDRPLGPDDCLYDVGCGKGAFLIRAAQRTACGRLVGVEYDPHLVEVARQAVNDAGFGLTREGDARCFRRCGCG
jgi:predicted RNA methylase